MGEIPVSGSIEPTIDNEIGILLLHKRLLFINHNQLFYEYSSLSVV